MRGQQLVRRDPALAILVGAVAAAGYRPDADFGNDEYGDDDDMGDDDYGDDDVGDDDYGSDFGASRRRSRRRGRRRPNRREMMLNPNKDSALKVEGYVFSVDLLDSTTRLPPEFGTAANLTGEQTPDVWIRPRRATLNVQDAGLVYISNLKVGNVSGTVGGVLDGYSFSAQANGVPISLPLMSPSTKANVSGSWTTFVPPARVPGDSFGLVMSLLGPATLAPRG